MDATEQAQRAQVVAEGLSWARTPYHHHGRVKGPQGGVDCLMLLAEVFERSGMVPRVEPGNYPRDWHLHRSEERYMAGLAGYARRMDEGEPVRPGDVALFRYGRAFSHSGLVVEAGARLRDVQVLHAYNGRGVIFTRLGEEPLDGRPVQFWTLW